MRSLKLFLKGLCMGSADIIPGVSGGTIALILGIYEELIFSIKSIDLRILLYFFPAIFDKKYREKVKKLFFSIRFDFLIPLILGIITAFLLLVNVISYFISSYRSIVYSFFLGLILASAIVIYLRVEKMKFLYLIYLFIGGISAYMFLSSTGVSLSHSLPIIFLSGIVTICAMILPGISGAFILLFLGQYEYMISALKSLYIPPLLTYSIGAFFGIIAFSNILSKLLRSHRSAVLSFLIGLMIGGLKKPIDNIDSISIFTIFSFLVGLILVIGIELYAIRRKVKWIKNL